LQGLSLRPAAWKQCAGCGSGRTAEQNTPLVVDWQWIFVLHGGLLLVWLDAYLSTLIKNDSGAQCRDS
jgi:hypothetical protein